jgi:hypothetical protein
LSVQRDGRLAHSVYGATLRVPHPSPSLRRVGNRYCRVPILRVSCARRVGEHRPPSCIRCKIPLSCPRIWFVIRSAVSFTSSPLIVIAANRCFQIQLHIVCIATRKSAVLYPSRKSGRGQVSCITQLENSETWKSSRNGLHSDERCSSVRCTNSIASHPSQKNAKDGAPTVSGCRKGEPPARISDNARV